MNPVSVAIKGKGLFNLLRRVVSIIRRYGLSARKMDQELAQFVDVLCQFGCGASFPITSVALKRHPEAIRKYHTQGIEFAIHGYRHLDHSQLTRVEQRSQLSLARQVFEEAGIPPRGFRGPYLRWNDETLAALQQLGLAYDSSQGVAWDVLDGRETSAYKHALDFYGALSTNVFPSLPSLEEGLVRIPYSLPDDEALVERLDLETPTEMAVPWLAILRRTYELGELFTLGLHPERTTLCLEPLIAVLTEARQFDPPVWFARLDEIADWWQARSGAEVEITEVPDGRLQISVTGPSRATVLTREVQVDVPTRPWADGYQQVQTTTFTVRAPLRPFIGLAPAVSPDLSNFVRQQGYIVETSVQGHRYAYYLDQADFTAEDQRPLLAQIERTGRPLVRVARWPNGARSAIAITGDIDALTLWDYGFRFLGN